MKMKSLGGNENYIEEKIKKLTGNKNLQNILKICRIMNRHDTDQLLVMNVPLSNKVWVELFTNVTNKLLKIHLPTIYGKVIQIDKENLIELPSEDIERFNVIVLEEQDNNLEITKIEKASKYDVNELLALIGRHPFVDNQGWHICKVSYTSELKECIGIGQCTLKARGGDYDGDAILLILLKLPRKYHEQYSPDVTETKHKISETITIPKSMDKAKLKLEIGEIQLHDFKFQYMDKNHCIVFPETISHLQNIQSLTGAILLAINVSTEYREKWSRKQLKENTEMLMVAIKQELEILRKNNPEKFKEYVQVFKIIHPTFLQIIVPLIFIENINLELYQAIIRTFVKDKGPSLFGYLQKIFLSTVNEPEDIERVLKWISDHQQKIIDMKKAEHSILDYNFALLYKSNKKLKESELGDLYKQWEMIPYNWSKQKWKLLTYGKPSCSKIDTLVTIIHNIWR